MTVNTAPSIRRVTYSAMSGFVEAKLEPLTGLADTYDSDIAGINTDIDNLQLSQETQNTAIGNNATAIANLTILTQNPDPRFWNGTFWLGSAEYAVANASIANLTVANNSIFANCGFIVASPVFIESIAIQFQGSAVPSGVLNTNNKFDLRLNIQGSLTLPFLTVDSLTKLNSSAGNWITTSPIIYPVNAALVNTGNSGAFTFITYTNVVGTPTVANSSRNIQTSIKFRRIL